MPRFFNPPTVKAPASNYSHGVIHALAGRRLVISGQIGVDSDGKAAEGLEAQLELAWRNFVAVVEDAGMTVQDVVKVTVFCTLPDGVDAFRRSRDKALMGHAPATTYLQVSGLASRDLVVEIEGEAVSEKD